MRIIISPAKQMRVDTDTFPKDEYSIKEKARDV